MSNANEAPWLAAWRTWMGLAGKAFKSPAGANPFEPRATAAAGFAQAYLDFARVVQQILKHGGGGDFASRFVSALQAAGRTGTGPAVGNDLLNAFLRAAPSALLSAFPDANAGQAWQQWSTTLQGWSAELLALPSLGPQREWQEMLKAVQRAALSEQAARARVDEHYRLAARTALERFGRFLHDDSGAPITTVRALYDAWIDQAEAAYAERVMSDAFAHDFGAWVDAGSDVRIALRALGGRLSAWFDTPRREEIDALIKRQHDLQRELATLRAERPAQRDRSPSDAPAVDKIAEPVSAPTPPATRSARPRAKAARKAANTALSVATVASKKMAKTPRPATIKAGKTKPAAGEFDIAHILDRGK